MKIKKWINKNKNDSVVVFAKSVIAELKKNPIYTYTSDEIKSSKYPHEMCTMCQQNGCDLKIKGYYCHKKCYKYVQQKVKKRIHK
jgi:hypothetical protein